MTADSPTGPAPDPLRLRALFDEALEQPEAQRLAWVNAHISAPEERAALLRLLAADGRAGLLDTPAEQRAARLGQAGHGTLDGYVGETIGPYRLLHLLGQGGMAAVFLAERVDGGFRQKVAVKLLRRGLFSELEQRMFRRERQALAALSHPHIAHLLDGGVTAAGVPFLVLEYVDGVAITEHAARTRLDLKGRLQLFCVVCRAVQAAHRQLIVHRDIKPSNILVTADGEVKLLDFGIAKLLDEGEEFATGTGLAPLTPGYAAPEQHAGGAVSTATDVFALGVLLHELLLGQRPDTRAPARPASSEAARAGRAAALPPAALRLALRGDLDNILRMAMDPDPARRYASAGELADDIERHLDARPVRAHPPARGYRLRKFLHRHRGGVALAISLLLLTSTGIGVVLWQADRARQESARANAVSAFMLNLFQGARASLPRDERLSPEQLVAETRRQLAASSELDAATQLALYRAVAEVALSLSAYDEAEAALAQAEAQLADRSEHAALDGLRLIRAEAWQQQGRYHEAAEALRDLLPRLRLTDTGQALRALGVLAQAEFALGEPEAAVERQREALHVALQHHGESSLETLLAGLELGNLLAASQRYPQAIEVLEPRLQRWRDAGLPEDDRYVRALASLAVARDGIGDLSDSVTRQRELLALRQRIHSAPHAAIARAQRALGQALARGPGPEEARRLFEEALAMQRVVYPRGHVEIAITLDALGALASAQQRQEEAIALYRQALELCAELVVRDDVCARSRNNLGQVFYRADRLDEAETAMREALAERRRLFGEDHPTIAYSLSTLSNVATRRQDYAAAQQLARDALDLLERIGHGRSREAALIRHGYAQALHLGGRSQDGLAEIERTYADWRALEPEGRVRALMILVDKARIQRDLGDRSGMAQTFRDVEALGVAPAELPERTRQVIAELQGG
jgi:tetratricopeptide (TPR) repeat protein